MIQTKRTIWSDPLHFIARGLGSGLAPVAPGTFGSVAGLFLYLLFPAALMWQIVIVVAGLFVGFWVCDVVGRDLGVMDHPSIVWDEIVGMWITLLFHPREWWILGLGFLLFRLFDIVKPWPINWIDEHYDNGIGVMADDVVAAIFANVCLWGMIVLIHAL